jgi:hypothetical protein
MLDTYIPLTLNSDCSSWICIAEYNATHEVITRLDKVPDSSFKILKTTCESDYGGVHIPVRITGRNGMHGASKLQRLLWPNGYP